MLVVLALLSSTSAYVRERTSSGAPYYWASPVVRLTVFRPSARLGLSDAALLKTMRKAAAAWSYPGVACTNVRIEIDSIVDARGRLGEDGVNAVVFQEAEWGGRDSPGRWRYAPTQLALTHVYARSELNSERNGEIVEADLEINAVETRWIAETNPTANTVLRQPRADRQAQDARVERNLLPTLIHEFGHILGLAHNCAAPGQRQLQDDRGIPIAFCGEAAGELHTEVMYPDPLDTVRSAVVQPTAGETASMCTIHRASLAKYLVAWLLHPPVVQSAMGIGTVAGVVGALVRRRRRRRRSNQERPAIRPEPPGDQRHPGMFVP